ncbi:cyanoglobin [Thermocrinis ruber]|uniref:Cyanoglobin n=1 Tax=Thermocrinis ruber TaxID=75906 RepID=W0DFM0_9AQUI|nr:group 1 truncated hemoglobin [Thermocrinis ruber]AHE95665.1 cyanoglobin [Thermocrinis ruber]
MKRALLFGLLLAGMLSAPAYAQMKEKSLYERLGGYDAISAVVNELATRLVTDRKLGVYFKGLSNDSKRKLIAHLTDFVCSATGGPCIYTGRDMKTAHEGLGITEEDWDRFVKITKEVLDKFKVPAREQQEFLQAVAPLKSVIVEKK